MTISDRIEINPKVMMGKPVIRGTCNPIELILRKLSWGATHAQLTGIHIRGSRRKIFTLPFVMRPTRSPTRKS